MKYEDIRVTTQDKKFFPNMLNNGLVKVCLKEDVDKYIMELEERLDVLRWRDCINEVPQENYFSCNYDWVLVKLKDYLSYHNEVLDLPVIAEYRTRKVGEVIETSWFGQDGSKLYLPVVAWRPIEKLCK